MGRDKIGGTENVSPYSSFSWYKTPNERGNELLKLVPPKPKNPLYTYTYPNQPNLYHKVLTYLYHEVSTTNLS